MGHSILIVEDHPLYRSALKHMMDDIVGAAQAIAVSSAEEGLRQLASRPEPSLILMDMGLPGVTGIEALTAFLRRYPTVPVAVLSASEERQEAAAVLRAGARIFLSKSVDTETLVAVVRQLLAGNLGASRWITSRGEISVLANHAVNLSARQKETLHLLLQGCSNKEIGLRLGLAEITVKTHVSALFRVLGVVNRTQAVLAAQRLGLGLAAGPPLESS
jgi:DNA-binding NarL/FixJ family response regulator